MGQVYENVEYQVQDSTGWNTIGNASSATDQEVMWRLDS